jgi:hypothetical protein
MRGVLLRRSVFIILAVAVLSAWINHCERAIGLSAPSGASHSTRPPTEWIRTADGWEPRAELDALPRTRGGRLHPALVAGFQLGASVFVLLAFPGRSAPTGSCQVVKPQAAQELRRARGHSHARR